METAKLGNGYGEHAMVLDCILVDITTNSQGEQILSNHAFKFKNTKRNHKDIEIGLGWTYFISCCLFLY